MFHPKNYIMVVIDSVFWIRRSKTPHTKKELRLLKTLVRCEETFTLLERAVTTDKYKKDETLPGLITFLCLQKHILDKHTVRLKNLCLEWKKSNHPQTRHLQMFLERKNCFFNPKHERELPTKHSVRVRMLRQNKTFTVHEWEDIFSIDTHTYNTACISPRLFILTQINMLRIAREHLA